MKFRKLVFQGAARFAVLAMVCGLLGCSGAAMPPGDTAEPEPGPIVYDVRMLQYDGVLSVRNDSDQDITGLAFSFQPKRGLHLSALSDRVSVLDDGCVQIQMDDALSGETSELDMSGLLHMYWNKDCESRFTYVLDDGTEAFIPGA